MDKDYTPLFQLHLQHEYFTDGNCPVMEVVPTQSTQQAMQRYDLRMVKRAYGYEFFCGLIRGQHPAISQLEEGFNLTFRLLVSDPLFQNYTEVGLADLQRLIYLFPNLDGAESLTLNLDKSSKPFPLIPPRTAENEDDLENLAIELSDGITENDFGLFLLRIAKNDTSQGLAYDPTRSFIPQTSIQFTARSTRWRYHLIAQQEIDNSSVKIVDTHGSDTQPDGTPIFAPSPIQTTLPDGSRPFVMVASGERKLLQRYSDNFTLELNMIQGDRTNPVSTPLPNPDPNRISLKTADTTPGPDPEFYSDLYIYL